MSVTLAKPVNMVKRVPLLVPCEDRAWDKVSTPDWWEFNRIANRYDALRASKHSPFDSLVTPGELTVTVHDPFTA